MPCGSWKVQKRKTKDVVCFFEFAERGTQMYRWAQMTCLCNQAITKESRSDASTPLSFLILDQFKTENCAILTQNIEAFFRKPQVTRWSSRKKELIWVNLIYLLGLPAVATTLWTSPSLPIWTDWTPLNLKQLQVFVFHSFSRYLAHWWHTAHACSSFRGALNASKMFCSVGVSIICNETRKMPREILAVLFCCHPWFPWSPLGDRPLGRIPCAQNYIKIHAFVWSVTSWNLLYQMTLSCLPLYGDKMYFSVSICLFLLFTITKCSPTFVSLQAHSLKISA